MTTDASTIIAIWSEKGGTGKTTTAVGLASVASELLDVVLIDLDPQANATNWLLGEIPEGPGAVELLTGQVGLDECAYQVDGHPQLRVVPSSIRLVRIIAELEDNPMPQLALRKALAGTTAPLIIIDCPPAYGALPVMALSAATHHVVPLKPAAMDLQAAQGSLKRAQDIRDEINPNLILTGFVLAMFDARTTVGGAIEQRLAQTYPGLPVVRIPSAVVVGMAPGANQLLGDYAPGSPATRAYRSATDALVRPLITATEGGGGQ